MGSLVGVQRLSWAAVSPRHDSDPEVSRSQAFKTLELPSADIHSRRFVKKPGNVRILAIGSVLRKRTGADQSSLKGPTSVSDFISACTSFIRGSAKKPFGFKFAVGWKA